MAKKANGATKNKNGGKDEAPLRHVIKCLREKAIATPPGQSIGSEEALIKEFDVSRPTFRNGAAIVAQEQLLAVRRGPGGGYFATRPDPSSVAHIAAIYLQARHTKLEEVLMAIEPLKVEMITLAANNRDEDMLSEWCAFRVKANEPLEEGVDIEKAEYYRFLKDSKQYGFLLGRACQNNVLELFFSALYEFCTMINPDEDLYREKNDRIKQHRELRQRIVDAIIDGDAEIGALLTKRETKLTVSWMLEDLSKRSSSRISEVDFPFSAIAAQASN